MRETRKVARVMKCAGIMLVPWLACAGLETAGAQQARITNEVLDVRWVPTSGELILARGAPPETFLQIPLPESAGNPARLYTIEDPVFGTGQALEWSMPGHAKFQVRLHPGLPLVLGMATFGAEAFSDGTLRRIELWQGLLTVASGREPWRVLGTGGLAEPDRNPGSYVWLAVVRPRSREGLVCGWLTHDRASGVWFTDGGGETVRVRARLDYGRVALRPGDTVVTETWAVGWFEDARLGLEQWAEAVARQYRIRLPPQPAGYCTWYSRPHGGASDEVHLRQLAEFAARELAPYGFRVVQIDDKWQAGVSTNGPRRNFTTHDPQGPYPSGMKAAADGLRALGLIPGLWFMPFAGTWYDPFFASHQDWFVRREDGQPYETAWGGTCLDLTHPGARAHVADVTRRIVHEWGFRYLKLDGLWTGTATRQQYINSGYKEDHMGDAVFHDPHRSNLEAYREGLRLVRAIAGPDVFLLGCNGPQNMRSYGGAIGLVDAMRVGPDNGPDWERLLRGPLFSSRQYFLHGRIWYNDPDPVYVRTTVPLEQARLLCSWVALSGHLWMNSDWLPELPPERLDILKRTLPAHGLRSRPADLFEREPARIWLLRDDRSVPPRLVLGLFNWTRQPWSVDEPIESLDLRPDTVYDVFDFWDRQRLPPLQERLRIEVPAAACRILALRPRADHPQLLSTSRHVTQGIVDVLEETWDPATRTLSGRSRVVAADPYEIRMVLPEPTGRWRVAAAEALPGDGSARAPAQMTTEDGLARVLWHPTETGILHWKVRFETGP